MNSIEVVQGIEGLFEAVCVSLFESLNCTVRRIKNANNEPVDAPIACIDAGSIDLELMTGLELPMSVLSLTYPVEGDTREVGEAHLGDWIGELSNQLIGRLKVELSDHDRQSYPRRRIFWQLAYLLYIFRGFHFMISAVLIGKRNGVGVYHLNRYVKTYRGFQCHLRNVDAK